MLEWVRGWRWGRVWGGEARFTYMLLLEVRCVLMRV